MTGEQLSASLMTVGRQLSDRFGNIPVKKIQMAVAAVMVLWIVLGVIQLARVLIPASAEPAGVNPGVERQPGAPTAETAVDIEALQAMNLFGTGGVAPEVASVEPAVDEELIDAEKTRLNLVLEGIVYSADKRESVAVIVHQGKQEAYYVGDKIPAGNQVSLAQVLLDRVILNNNGNYEALWLYDESDKGRSSPAPDRSVAADSRVEDLRSDASVTDMAKNYRERVFNNPTSLAEVIRITPATRDGEMVGYRISPGKDRKQFETLGLQANDIVTSINNIDLNEPTNALEVYKLMRTATEATFTINRNGETIEIRVALGEQ